MNYLAHIFLAKNDAFSVVGNLMGDFLKGVNTYELPDQVRQGIRNHQSIDVYTDNHPSVCALKKYLSNDRKRFSSIISDVIFDYFLIKHWDQFTGEDFNQFVDNVYQVLLKNRDIMPDKMQFIITRMVKMDWFRSYSSMETMGFVLDRISQRIRFENNLCGAIDEVLVNYNNYETAFLTFFPQLISHVDSTNIEKEPN